MIKTLVASPDVKSGQGFLQIVGRREVMVNRFRGVSGAFQEE